MISPGPAGDPLAETLMGTGVIEVRNVFLHYPVQVPFPEQDEEVEALAPPASPEALADGVRLQGTVGRQQYSDARPLHRTSCPDRE